MASSFPPDVVVVDAESVIHARLQGGRKNPQLVYVGAQRLPAGVFTPAVVSPAINDSSTLSEAIRRLKREAGRLDRVSLLLPDAWFRIHLSDLAELPDRREQADEMVRWTLRRSLPMKPEDLRMAYQAISRSNGTVKVLVLAAIEKTLSRLEEMFREQQIEVTLIEPIGLNIWNAISVREATATGDRLFFYFRRGDFTTAVFRGQTPLFIRSRYLGVERTLLQEIRLSASYLRANPQWQGVQECLVASNEADQALLDAIAQEFDAPVKRVALRDFAEWPATVNVRDHEAELTACTGVFTE